MFYVGFVYLAEYGLMDGATRNMRMSFRAQPPFLLSLVPASTSVRVQESTGAESRNLLKIVFPAEAGIQQYFLIS